MFVVTSAEQLAVTARTAEYPSESAPNGTRYDKSGADQHSPKVVLEVRATSEGVRYAIDEEDC